LPAWEIGVQLKTKNIGAQTSFLVTEFYEFFAVFYQDIY